MTVIVAPGIMVALGMALGAALFDAGSRIALALYVSAWLLLITSAGMVLA